MSGYDHKIQLSEGLDELLTDTGNRGAYVIGSAADPPIPAENSETFVKESRAAFAEATNALTADLAKYVNSSDRSVRQGLGADAAS